MNTDMLLLLAGPVLRGYLEDTSILNILVNPNGTCFIERFAQPKEAVSAPDPADLDRFLAGVADSVQQEWREQTPTLHAALATVGWRIQAAMPPQAPDLTMAIRKHPVHGQIFTLDDYREGGILTAQQDTVIRDLLATGSRILVSGATGSGKTSVVNAMLHELEQHHVRRTILEDDPELIDRGTDVMFLRTKPGTSMADLVKESLRYQPQWIIVGEVRGHEAYPMCRAFDSGHFGISTVHATSAEQTLLRVEELISTETKEPWRLLSRVIEAVIHMQRTAQGLVCTGILTVEGYVNGAYQLQPLA